MTLVIAVALLCKRQWWFVLGGSVLVGLSFSLGSDVGQQCVAFSRQVGDYLGRFGFPLDKMHCWYGFWKLLLPGFDLRMVLGATLLTGLATIAVLVRLL